MPATPPMYLASATGPGSSLRQGEILSELDQFRLDIGTLGTANISGQLFRHPFAVLLTQDCDLEQDSVARAAQSSPDKVLPSLLFCEVATAIQLRGSGGINSNIWAQVKLNKHERYQFLQRVDATRDALKTSLPEMGIDFKRYFTIPTDEVYRRIELGEAKRRCVMLSPYLEHLSSRFAYFLSRVALPLDHASE